MKTTATYSDLESARAYQLSIQFEIHFEGSTPELEAEMVSAGTRIAQIKAQLREQHADRRFARDLLVM
jgi:hypothetical protein